MSLMSDANEWMEQAVASGVSSAVLLFESGWMIETDCNLARLPLEIMTIRHRLSTADGESIDPGMPDIVAWTWVWQSEKLSGSWTCMVDRSGWVESGFPAAVFGEAATREVEAIIKAIKSTLNGNGVDPSAFEAFNLSDPL
jgi:hypothetical protein